MATDHNDRAEHWLALECEALAAAVETADERTRTRLLSVASVYDKLALRAETAAVVVRISLQKKLVPDGIR